LAVIGGLLILFIVVIGAFVGALVSGLGEFDEQPTPLKSKTVLVVDLSEGVVEYRPPVVINFGGDEAGIHLHDAVTAIEDAANDPKIEGILYRAGGSVGFTKLTEIRDAMVKFKESGKFMYAYMEGGSKSDYYLASVADSIFMPAEGLMAMNAFGATGVFVKEMTEKIGVDFYVEQFEEYKSAAEQVSRTGWSDPAKESIRAIIAQREQMWVDAVASSRGMDAGQIRTDISGGIYIPDSLKAHGYIDGMCYEWELRENLARRIDPDDTTAHPKLRVKSLSSYAKSNRDTDVDTKIDRDRTFAIVYASGNIMPGSNNDPFDQGGIYSKDLIKQLRKAWKDDDVEAILLRVDSPGGSALASDEIWTTIQEIRKDKPIYASMSDVAASGGYYIAMACDTIIAAPSTITGSIGVIMAIPNLSGTMGKIGVTTDTISFGPSSTFMNTLRPFEADDKAQLRAFGAGIYKRFVQKVADSRGMDFEEARALAKGRVWTGEDALKAGLIDMMGDFDDAIAAIKKRMGVDPDTKIMVKVYPEKVDNLTALLKMFGIDRGNDDEDVSGPSNTSVRDLLVKAYGPSTPVDEILATLPPDARRQLEHAAAMTMIGLKEPTMMMLPAPVPVF